MGKDLADIKNPVDTDDILRPLFLQLPPEHIVFLKFTLESYEGLGILRTLDSTEGIVVYLAVKDTVETAKEVIAAIGEEVSIRYLSDAEISENPNLLGGDWLLNT